ncbi:YrhB domain-containing protein [Chryseobacterium hispalense]|uniref:YrhB domain-containing protein n=1 Tax=Chryseobacterium hispalense TaxID=1453492 RepID=UPI00391DD7B1
MLTEKEISEIANKYIKEIEKRTGIELLIGDEETIKKPYGNIYFYTSKKWYETGDDRYAVAGNAPFLVEKETGNVIVFGTARTEDYYIKEYEAGRWPLNKF